MKTALRATKRLLIFIYGFVTSSFAVYFSAIAFGPIFQIRSVLVALLSTSALHIGFLYKNYVGVIKSVVGMSLSQFINRGI